MPQSESERPETDEEDEFSDGNDSDEFSLPNAETDEVPLLPSLSPRDGDEVVPTIPPIDLSPSGPNPSTSAQLQAPEHEDGPCVAILEASTEPGTLSPPNPHETTAALTAANNQPLIIADGSRARRVRKSRTFNLKACMCGVDVSEAEIQAGETVLQCKVQGCETSWVCHDLHFGFMTLA
jgi:hypothetical protein